MTELRKKHKELCDRKDAAEREYNAKHREAKYIKQNVIMPLEEEIKSLERQMYPKSK